MEILCVVLAMTIFIFIFITKHDKLPIFYNHKIIMQDLLFPSSSNISVMHYTKSMWNAISIWLFSFVILAICSPNTASAHEIRPAVVDFVFDKTGVYQLSITHNLEALLADISSDHEEAKESENDSKYMSLRNLSPTELEKEFEKISDDFLQKMQLSFDTNTENLQILDVDIPEVGDIELARESIINIAGIIPENAKKISWQWDKKYGNAVFRISSEDNPELFSSYLTDGSTSEQVAISVDCYDSEKAQKVGGCLSQQSKWDVFKNYIKVGFVHIIPKGLDHILFVVGLFLLSAQLRPLLIQITTFTLAHSVTLALGIYGIVNVSASIVEPLIAASIVYVCIENIYSAKLSRWRPFVIFAFGLLHGLGFASVLGDFGLSAGSFATGLIAFNIGVELGQLAVITACFLLVGLWFRNKPWYRKFITIPASIIIALIAIYWVFERTGIIGG